MARTEIARAQYRRDDLEHASDLRDAEWRLIEPLMPVPGAHYIVGVFSATVELNAVETDMIGSAYALKNSRDPFDIMEYDAPLWEESASAHNNGFFK